jgi:uncharacterized protein (TIGR03435 family)
MLLTPPLTTALAGALACCLLTSGISFGQTRAEFEVASIRPSSDQINQVNVGLRITGSQARIDAMSLKDYIGIAYRLMPQQIDGPEWLAQLRFNIAATIPEGASTEKVPEMFQALLEDRFQLKSRRERREFAVYALTVKGDLKLQPSVTPDAAPATPGVVDVAGGGSGNGVGIDLGGGASFSLAGNRLEARKMTMTELAEMLTRFLDRPVVDATALSARYDLTLDLALEDYMGMLIRGAVNGGMPVPPQALRLLDGASGEPLSSPLQKYGLTLESRRSPLDVLVVEAMSKAPTEN